MDVNGVTTVDDLVATISRCTCMNDLICQRGFAYVQVHVAVNNYDHVKVNDHVNVDDGQR